MKLAEALAVIEKEISDREATAQEKEFAKAVCTVLSSALIDLHSIADALEKIAAKGT